MATKCPCGFILTPEEYHHLRTESAELEHLYSRGLDCWQQYAEAFQESGGQEYQDVLDSIHVEVFGDS